ncbi:MAG: 3-hydroxyacyl-CoA dehydrogenase family protein [Thermodesulfobacteriota bacterium]
MKTKEIKRIGILGTGTIGASWATFFSSKGIPVKMYDVDTSILERGVRKAKENLGTLVEYGMLDKAKLRAATENVLLADDLREMVEDADYVQESVLEDYDVKKKIFHELDLLAPENVILASSSSGLLMSEIQSVTEKPQRCLIAHPFNPPHLVPLVELVPGRQTDLELVQFVKGFFEGLGKIPVLLKKEAPGHIANRLAAALWRESIEIVTRGIASVEDVDKALYAGPGIRWALMGQHLIYHLGGGEGGYEYFIDHIGKAFGTLWEDMPTWTEISDESKKTLVEGIKDAVGDKSLTDLAQWRDKKIVDLVKVIYEKPRL